MNATASLSLMVTLIKVNEHVTYLSQWNVLLAFVELSNMSVDNMILQIFDIFTNKFSLVPA